MTMMLHQTDLGNARMADLIESARRDAERRQLNHRGPLLVRLRLVVARRMVLAGARLHGEEPAVIGRVVILDRCGHAPNGLRPAA
jgi:hypothetical protein